MPDLSCQQGELQTRNPALYLMPGADLNEGIAPEDGDLHHRLRRNQCPSSTRPSSLSPASV